MAQAQRDVEALRAICLLALGRDEDARAAMLAVIDLDPQFAYAEAEIAPRIRSMFVALRAERLPDLVRLRYAAARDAFAARGLCDGRLAVRCGHRPARRPGADERAFGDDVR